MELGTAKDTTVWKQYLVPESKQHPARFNAPMLIGILELWTKPGDLILDPMMGVGTILIALTMGRRVIGIELMKQWYDIAQRNLAFICGKCGCSPDDALLLQGDAALLLPIPVDVVITSPPYGYSIHDSSPEAMDFHSMEKLNFGYGHHPAQIGSYKYAQQRLLMRDIYKGCHSSLSAGGRMILVTKDVTEARQRVYVGADTMTDCVNIGFSVEERAIRRCARTGLQELQKAKRAKEGDIYEPIQTEDIVVYRR